ncbi:MAG: Crp/Fnr family transcriptional regulator [Lachnospiraceae bacterium]|nr:Crp/Fnr family transcriptional regulator [Lachnospiraceae bacterium]
MNYSDFLKIPLFENFKESDVKEALEVLSSRTCAYSKDQLIYHEGSYINEMGIVQSGSIRIERIDYQGNRNILAHIEKGQIFAETYAMLKNEPLMIDVVANIDCEVLFLNLKKIETLETMKHSWHSAFIINLLKISNRKNLELSKRNFHTFSKHIRSRVLSYLIAQSRQRKALAFDIPFNRQQMADYLNLDRSALSNELCKMRDDGLILFHKNHFQLLISNVNIF